MPIIHRTVFCLWSNFGNLWNLDVCRFRVVYVKGAPHLKFVLKILRIEMREKNTKRILTYQTKDNRPDRGK